MKRFLFPLLLASAVACGGDDSNPLGSDTSSNTQKQVPVVTSGRFTMTATKWFDGCERLTDWNGEYNISIDGTVFSMPPFYGTWDASRAKGLGDTEHDQFVSRSCIVTTWSAIDITFTTEDAFHGSIIYRYRADGEYCGARNPCATTWLVSGVRKQTETTP